MGMTVIKDSKADILWKKIRDLYDFKNYSHKAISPSNLKYKTYSLKNINIMTFSYNADGEVSEEYKYNADKLKKLFASYFKNGMYVLDWQHDCFEVDSYEFFSVLNEEAEGIWMPSFLPEADTVFFLSKDLMEGWITDFNNGSIIVVGEDFIGKVDSLEFDFLD
ncbi:DUF2716 domain-containing protein [Listeria marthii]|nr:DUF2716 domain-containing protein [Listeria marthii]